MGVVYKAEDTKLRRLVALKFLPQQITVADEDKARFLQEARAISALNHPNIATIHDIDEANGQKFLVLEYIPGGTVKAKLKQLKSEDREFSLAEVLDYGIQAAAALAHAHRRQIIHRDVKTDNLMLTDEGKLKLTDFGLAKLRGSVHVTKTGTMVGTAAYMSPEQIQGGEVDARSDIFSFGVVLFEMLTGRLPFRGEHEAAMMYSITNEEPLSLSSLRKDVPERLDRIILRALEKDVNRRYQDVLTIVGLLKEVSTVSPSDLTQHLLAVLPFDNISPDKENEYFSDGLTEEIIASLSKIRSLKVISRTSVMRYKGTDKSLNQIARELHAKYVLEGSVRKHDQELRITAQLIDADQDVHLWAEKYRGNLRDVFDIQEKVAGRIVKALKVRLTPDEKQTLKKRFTEDSEAYQLYLQGRYFWNRRTEDGMNAAIKYFEKAVERDPRYSLAWAGLADSYNLLGEYGNQVRRDLYPKAKVAVSKALEIDSRLAEAHTSLGSLLMLNEWDWTNAEKEFKLGISLNPNYATAHHWYSEWLMFMGRLEESLHEISRAVELDPVSQAILKDKGFVHYYSRHYDEAIELARKTLELDPHFFTAHRLLSLSYQGKKMFDEAITENQQWGALTRNELESSLALAQLYAVSGRREEARNILENLESGKFLKGSLFRGMALVYAALEENDIAFEWLEKGYERRDESLTNLKIDPKMDKLRTDLRFASLLQRIGLER